MKNKGYYSSGELMKIAHITKKAVRYYDSHNILKPSYVSPSGARFYTDADLAKLQQILLLKSLGFALGDIREMTIKDSDSNFMHESLKLQLKLVEDRIEQYQVIAQAIQETSDMLKKEQSVDWSHMLDLIHLMGMEKSMKNQYQNSSNISARINLHTLYSQNKQGWFPWIFEHCHLVSGMRILEIGCGDGTFWAENLTKLPTHIDIALSDISEGMLRDTRRTIGNTDERFSFQSFDCENIPFANDMFDLVIANHVLFYCDDVSKACVEIKRVLKNNGIFLCSTYGSNHMQEITQLVKDFDNRIVLSADKLYEKFGKENGKQILSPYFLNIHWENYHDSLLIPEPEPLISYVLSCHGNQNQFILDRYKEFRSFVKSQIHDGFSITKEAGIYVCKN